MKLLKRKGRLLLLDDDPAMQRLISTLLQRSGFRIDVVSAGAAAIEKLGTVDYAVLLLDLMTPTEGGLTVIRHLKETRPDLLRRVLIVTASPASVLKMIEHDVAGIVQKPFEPAQLLAAVENVITTQ
jgi:two-component system response regulator CpxR